MASSDNSKKINKPDLDLEKHKQIPIFEALKKHIDSDIIPFHVPAHKYGEGLQELREYTGNKVFLMDLNSMYDLDDLCNPKTSIDTAQKLAAEAFHSEYAYYLINGHNFRNTCYDVIDFTSRRSHYLTSQLP